MTKLSRYSLEDLAKAAELSPRTVRYYIAQDLLPGPESLGRKAWYSEAHLHRLKCIKAVQKATGLPLSDVRPVVNQLTEEQIRDIATGRERVMALPVGASEPGTSFAKSGRDAAPRKTSSGNQRGKGSGASEENDALNYIRSIRSSELADTSRLGAVAHSLERLAGGSVPRRSRNDWWATVSITPDIEIRARGLDEQDVGELERLADLIRHLLMKGTQK